MKNVTQALMALAFFFQWVNTFGQSLGAYPNTVMISGQNATVFPSIPPTGTDYLFAYTNTNFSGMLSVNPITGVVSVTNPLTAGTFYVTVKAFGQNTTSQNFTLTVNNPVCSDAEFSDNGNLAGFYNPQDIAIGDFNNDGIQDFITSDYSYQRHSIGLGNGVGGFSGYVSPQCSSGCQYHYVYDVTLGDFNGDGYHDAIFNRYYIFDRYYFTFRWGNYIEGVTKIPHYSNYNSDVIQLIFIDKGDFNNDGFPDLVSRNTKGGIYIEFGNVTGQNIPLKILPFSFLSLKIGDFNSDGNQDMALLLSSSVNIKLGDGLGGFSDGGTVAVGDSPKFLVIGDFNTDGKQDLATSNASKSLSIRLGDGLGGFTGNTEVALIEIGEDPAVGDFNGDGKQDLAILHKTISKVSIVLGDGLGGFSANKQVSVGEGSRSLAVGEFNGDGILDLVTVNDKYNNIFGGASGTVSIRLGIPKLPMSASLQGNGVNIINGDYSPSLNDHTDFGAVLMDSSVKRIFTIKNSGASPISVVNIKSSNPHFMVDSVPTHIGVGGSVQFTITFSPLVEFENATISILLGDCMGFYKFAVRGKTIGPVVLGTYPNATIMAGQNITITPSVAPRHTKSAVAFTHTNFSGLFTVNPTTGKVTITDAKQAGIYTVKVMAFGTDSSTQTFTLTVTNPECSEGLFNTGVNFGTGLHPSSVAIGDFNKDGKQDVAIANSNAKTVSIRIGDGNGGFTGSVNVPIGFKLSSIAIGDFNGDGNQDFVTANPDSDNVSIKLGDALGGFSGSSVFNVGDYPNSVAIGDFNGDGKQDFVTANHISSNITIRLGDGNGSFGGGTSIPVGTFPSFISIGDFNGDGKQDLATANRNNVSILLGDGLGGFGSVTNINVGASPSSLAIGDFNGDGKQDFASANQGSANVSIRLGDGVGGFIDGTNVSVGISPMAISIGDFNGDGNQDFVISNAGSGNFSIQLGDGSGGFMGTSAVLATGVMSSSNAIGDFNGDGIHDFASANHETQNFSIFMGKSALALTSTWLGISADWNTPGNWSTGKVPGICTHVIVNSGVPFLPIVSGINNKCFSLLLNNGATIHMGKDAKLRINGK